MNNREKVRRAFSPLAADPETVNAVMATASAQPQRRPVRRALRTVMVAAMIVLLLTGSAYAAVRVSSPNQAWNVTKQELARMQEIGLLPARNSLDNRAGLSHKHRAASHNRGAFVQQ